MNKKVWRSFCSNYVNSNLWQDENYNNHGHVGFAWGAKIEILKNVPLFDRALIGGADHIVAHASTGQISHSCITKSFTDNLDEIYNWSEDFYKQTKGKVGFVKGDLYHIWHGDIEKRDYLKRIKDFTSKTKYLKEKDENGLFVSKKEHDDYFKKYYKTREVFVDENNDFFNSMLYGYVTDSASIGAALGGNLTGAIVGDLLNDNSNQYDKKEENYHDNSENFS